MLNFQVPREISNVLVKFEKYFHTSSNPNYSLTRVILTKLRVVAEWSLRRMLELGIRRQAFAPLRSLRNSASDRTAIVMANGPSLNLISLAKVSDAQKHSLDVFVVNYFPITQGTELLRPNYLVLSDPVTKPTSTNNRSLDLWAWIDSHPEVKIICPSSWFRQINKSRYALSRFLFFDDTSLISWTKNISPLRARSYLSMTAYKALSVAVYLGYSEIDVIGFDNNQVRGLIVDENNRIIQGPNHFAEYSVEADITDRLSAGVSDYFYDFSAAFSDLRKFSHKGNIWNLDPKSYVDAFPKKLNSEFRISD